AMSIRPAGARRRRSSLRRKGPSPPTGASPSIPRRRGPRSRPEPTGPAPAAVLHALATLPPDTPPERHHEEQRQDGGADEQAGHRDRRGGEALPVGAHIGRGPLDVG